MVNAEARITSDLDAEAHSQCDMQELTADGSETIVGVAAASSGSQLGTKEDNRSSREVHFDTWECE